MTHEEWLSTPELVGERVRLVPLSADHAEGVLAAADDEEVFRWLSVERPHELEGAQTLVARYLAMHPSVIAWAQIDQETGELAGVTTYYDIDPAQHTVAIGWTWLARRHWRTALNTEAKLLLLTRAFDDLGCVRVVWHTDIGNERSQAAITRLGAHREGVLRKHKLRRDGSWRDTVIFSITDDEWPTARKLLRART